MKFAKTLQMTTNTLPEEYKERVLNYKKFKKSINKIVSNLEDTGVYELPENEKCKIVYSLSNDGKDETNIKSSLILFIDKDYVAELSSKDALELNSEEIKIDHELNKVYELSDDKEAIVTTKVTKEKILKSFQTAKGSKNDFIYNKKVPLNRLSRNSTLSGNKSITEEKLYEYPSNAESSNKDSVVVDIKRSKSDGELKSNKILNLKMKCVEEPEEMGINNNDNEIASPQSLIMEGVKRIQISSSSSSSNNEKMIPMEESSTSALASTSTSTSTSEYASTSTFKVNTIDTPLTPPKTPENTPNIINSENNANNTTNLNDTNNTNANNININNISNTNTNTNDSHTSQNSTIPEVNETNISEAQVDVDVNADVDVDVDVDGFIDCTNTAKDTDEKIIDIQFNDNITEEDMINEIGKDESNAVKSLKVLLETDAKFLNDLAAALSQLSAFQDKYKQIFETKINFMSNIMADVSSPMMSDTYKWREILNTYIESDIWMYRGKDRAPEDTIHQLKMFERKIAKINKRFNMKKSQQLLNEFIQLNYDIVAIKRFYELNQTAVYKILKKHDKRTHLLASEGFPKFASDETFFRDNIARSLVFQISSRLLTVIPNPDEYACPICKELSYKPIRLDCGHLYCLRCLVKAQKQNISNCPLCRAPNVVSKANSLNLDKALMKKMRVEFPREVKKKLNTNKSEKAQEDSENMLKIYGYSENSCVIM